MGKTYTNIHIKKNDVYSYDSLREYVIKYMKQRGAEEVERDESDTMVAVYSPCNSDWITISAEDIEFTDYKSVYANAKALSDFSGSDVITASCCDSDWGYISLVNSKCKEKSWININVPYTGLKLHRTSISSWTKRVSDFNSFKAAVAKNRTMAEETFEEIAPMINMDISQTDFMYDNVDSADKSQVEILCFKTSSSAKKQSVKFKLSQPSLSPCHMDRGSAVFAYNVGEKSRGIGILFYGDWVENDDITIKEVSFGSNIGDIEKRCINPIELKKVKLTDGNYGLCWEDKEFCIPAGVGLGMSESKKAKLILNKEFGVWFTPSGNSRKALDIKVAIYPLMNRSDGGAVWYCYRGYKSKEEYIVNNNKHIKSLGGMSNQRFAELLLNKEDYDL